MTIEQIDNHRAKACWKCGSVNFALLKSRFIECNQCGEPAGTWEGAQIKQAGIELRSHEHTQRLKNRDFKNPLMRKWIEDNLHHLGLTPISNERD